MSEPIKTVWAVMGLDPDGYFNRVDSLHFTKEGAVKRTTEYQRGSAFELQEMDIEE